MRRLLILTALGSGVSWPGMGVVIQAQADMWEPEKGAAHQAGYEPFVKSVAEHTVAFGHPVLMFNGDSHVYQSNNPFSPAEPVTFIHPGYDVPNFSTASSSTAARCPSSTSVSRSTRNSTPPRGPTPSARSAGSA
jgi:hypothetical protein